MINRLQKLMYKITMNIQNYNLYITGKKKSGERTK